MKKPYIELLKDPRWQRKRLEILSRDGFICQRCADGDSTLHVHHRFYESGLNPWEYEDRALTTLCDHCHDVESKNLPVAEKAILKSLKKSGFHSAEISLIADILSLDSGLFDDYSRYLIVEAIQAAVSVILRGDDEIAAVNKFQDIHRGT